ncbi:hypothetical protein Tco_0469444 [Tanacetum coccineum]
METPRRNFQWKGWTCERFHGIDDAKEIWEAIRTRFSGNENSKKMQKAVFKQQLEAFKISSSEGLENGYDRCPTITFISGSSGAEESTARMQINKIPADFADELAIPSFKKSEDGTANTDGKKKRAHSINIKKLRSKDESDGHADNRYGSVNWGGNIPKVEETIHATYASSSKQMRYKDSTEGILKNSMGSVTFGVAKATNLAPSGGVTDSYQSQGYRESGRISSDDEESNHEDASGTTSADLNNNKQLWRWSITLSSYIDNECLEGNSELKGRYEPSYSWVFQGTYVRRFHRMGCCQKKLGALRIGFVGNGKSKEDAEICFKNQQFKRTPFYQDHGVEEERVETENCLLIWMMVVVQLGRTSVEEEDVYDALMAIRSSIEDLLGLPLAHYVDPELRLSVYLPEVSMTTMKTEKWQEERPEVKKQRGFNYWPNINSVRPNINTGRTNVNPVRPRVNTGSSNVNTVRSRQPVPNKNSTNFNPKRPQVTRINWRILKNSMGDLLPLEVAKATYLVTPKTSHLNAVKRIFKYLKGKPNLGLWYPRESPFDLEAFSDSDYGGSNLDRKSTTGGCQFLGQRLISWQCKKQTIVATSTTEAEYVAAANCCGQVLWVQNQLLDYGFNFMNTKIHIDNESTICIVKNPVYHSKTKHIEIRHHFIRDCYEKKLISVEKIHTDLNVADLLTKPFDGPRFNFLVTAIAITLADGTLELKATIDTIEYTITEASIRSKLQLADASGITMLPNNEIFEGMGHMGYPTDGSFTFWKSFFTPQWRFLVHHILHYMSSKSGGWDQFGSNIATALICLSTGRVYNFSKLIFDGMVANLKSKTKFLMYPRFLQMILDIQTENKHLYLAVTLTKKIFGNMKRGFRGVPRPLLPAMLSIVDPSAGQEAPSVTQPQQSSIVVPPTPPTTQLIPSEATTIPPITQPAPPTPIAETTTASSLPSPSPAHEPMKHTFEQPSTDQQPPKPRQEATTSQLMTRIGDLEKQLKETKQTFRKAILTLVDRVKTLEVALKRKTKRVLLSDSKEEETEAQEDSRFRSSGFFEVAAILTKVQKIKSVDKGKRYKRRKSSKEFTDTGLDFEEVKSAFEKVNIGGIRVLVPSPNRGKREGKAPMTEEEETQASRKTKEQILQEEAGLAEAIK